MCFWAPIIAAHVVHLSMGCRALQQCPCGHPVPTLAAAAAGRDVPPWAATAFTAAPTHPLLSLASPALQYEISMDAYERLSNTTGAWQLDEDQHCRQLWWPVPALTCIPFICLLIEARCLRRVSHSSATLSEPGQPATPRTSARLPPLHMCCCRRQGAQAQDCQGALPARHLPHLQGGGRPAGEPHSLLVG